jgi:hypothetical protein
MCGRVRLSSDVSEIKLAFSVPVIKYLDDRNNQPGVLR